MDDIVLYDMKSPRIPKDWNYKKSVIKMRKLVVNWKNISVEILQELHIAKTKLYVVKESGQFSCRGFRCLNVGFFLLKIVVFVFLGTVV